MDQPAQLLHSVRSADPQGQCVRVKEKPLTFRVARDPAAAKSKHMKDEILTLEEMDLPGCSLSLHVYINLPEADERLDANVAEYVGSFHGDDKRMTSPKFSIRSNVQALGLQDASEIWVSIIPKGEEKDVPVPFKGARVSVV